MQNASPTTTANDWLSRPLGFATQLDWEKTAYLLILIVAIISRFWALGDRAVSHDESLHTQYSYQYYNGEGYVHTPLMHGPFLFHVTALSYWLFGHSDFTARIPAAVVGIAFIFLPYFVRHWIGRRGALVASFLLLISPYMTYYSRYIREDIFSLIALMVVFIASWHYLRDGLERGEKSIYWFAFGLGWLFTTKEVSFIYVAIFGSFLVYRLVLQIIYQPWFKSGFRQIVAPLAIMGVGILLLTGGFVGKASLERSLSTAENTPTAQPQFAVDPTDPATMPVETASTIAGVSAMRWVQIAGLITLSMGLFLVASTWRPHLQDLPEFDLIILYTTLILPSITPLFVVMAGWNPLDYNLSRCFVEGQETMGALAMFWAKLFNGQCWSIFLQSGIMRTALFAVPILGVSIALGLWWNGRIWLISAAIFHIFFTLLHTALFTNPSGWASGTIGALGYWLEQHDVQRGSQPWFYYGFVTTFYEFVPILLTLLGARLWAQKARIHRATSYWCWFLFIALISASYTNWVYNRAYVVPGQDATRVPGVVLAAVILSGGFIYWALTMWGNKKSGLPTLPELIRNESLTGMPFFLMWWTVLNIIAYSWAGEKMPWLSTHLVLPMILMAGWYFHERLRDVTWAEVFNQRALLYTGLTAVFLLSAVLALAPLWLGQVQFGGQDTAALRGTGRFLGGLLVLGGLVYLLWQQRQGLETAVRERAWLFSIFAILALLTMRFTYMANWPNGDLATEYLVYAHGAPATKQEILPQLEQLSMRLHGDMTMQVIYDNESSWPYTWYLRNFPNRRYVGESFTPDVGDAPALVIGNNNWGKVEPYLRDNYDYQTYTYLWWPMEEYRQLGWEALLGNPDQLSRRALQNQGFTPDPANVRRGLGNPEVRHALWDIFFYRDYTKYGQVYNRTYNLGSWPLRDEVRLYIRKDVKANLWDYGVAATAVVVPEDPYKDKAFNLQPNAVIGQGLLNRPRNVTVGPDGRLYVADAGNHRIVVFEDGQVVLEVGGEGAGAGQFNEPWGVAVDDEAIYVADTWNHRIQKFDLNGEFITSFGQSGTVDASQAATAGGIFFGPRTIVLLPNNLLAVSDTGNHRIQIFDRDGNFVQGIGGLGALMGQFYEPVGLAAGVDGSLFVADTWNERIQQLSPTLSFALFEWSVSAWRSQSIENKPYMAADAFGRLYVTDPEGYRVLMFGPDGSYLGRFGEYSPTSSGFGLPNGIALDADNNIYVVDSANGTILRFPNPLQ